MTWKNVFKRPQFESGVQLEARHILKLFAELISHCYGHDFATCKQAVRQSAQTPNLSNTHMYKILHHRQSGFTLLQVGDIFT